MAEEREITAEYSEVRVCKSDRLSVIDVDPRVRSLWTDESHEHTVDPDTHDALMARLPGLCTPKVILDALLLRWLGGEATCKKFVEAHASNALLHSLLLEVATHGLFHELEPAEEVDDVELGVVWLPSRQVLIHAFKFLWCAAFLTFLYGTVISVLLSAAANELLHEHQFRHFTHTLGKYMSHLPILLLWWGIFLLWLALIIFFALSNTWHFTGCCLAACSVILVVHSALNLKMVVALETAQKTQEAFECAGYEVTADDVYKELQKYFEVDCNGQRSFLNRGVFLNRFVVYQSEYVRQLASVIYDDWMDKSVRKQLREDPGF